MAPNWYRRALRVGGVVGLLGCAGQPASPPDAALAPVQSLGLRVALSEHARSVCVAEAGCGGIPKGAVRIQPLEPKLRTAVSEALVGMGLELVDRGDEPDVEANLEWHGTDIIALRLEDAHGRLIDQARYRRSLERCRDLPQLTWDSCWVANFPRMKQELIRPLRASAKLQALARRAGHHPVDVAAAPAPSGPPVERPAGSGATPGPSSAQALPERLDAQHFQATVAHYREELQRSCWLTALEARDASAPRVARVDSTVTVSPSGQVAKVTVGADPVGYPRLAGCIATQLWSWRFPPARDTSHADIPFVFVSD